MEVNTTGGISGSNPIQPDRISAGKAEKIPPKPARADRTDISVEARLLSKLREVPDVRWEKVEALKALIAKGQYETPERIAGAVEKLLEELG